MTSPERTPEPPVSPEPDVLAYGIADAARVTGTTVWTVRQAIWSGQLPAVRRGRAYVITRAALLAWVEAPPQADAS